ncbi:hypothetical protein BASA81_015306 [Batrachochytrium salamandrivorans]|nr:hypothetical protein BASA81_015306 [Batrachochytrium salamandrivorans]
MTSVRKARVGKEIKMLLEDPPPGVVVFASPREDDDDEGGDLTLAAQLSPGADTPYAGGVFALEVGLGPRYPFEPPSVKFQTKLFHPNVDESGRICLDSLKLPPAGSWRPSLNLRQVLSQLVILFGEPGLGDPLMKEIADLYKNDHERYCQVAREWTRKHAMPQTKRVRLE